MNSKIYELSDEEFKELVSLSLNYNQVLSFFGMRNKGSNSNTIKKRIQVLHIDTNHFNLKGNSFQTKYSDAEVFRRDSQYTDNRQLKKKLIKAKHKIYICEVCGIGPYWNNKELILQLDHINGKSNDNRIENLRFICPNCHAQTSTFGTKQSKRHYFCKQCSKSISKHSKSGYCRKCCIPKPITKKQIAGPIINIEKLKVLCKEILPNTKIAKQLGCSDVTVGKWRKRLNI